MQRLPRLTAILLIALTGMPTSAVRAQGTTPTSAYPDNYPPALPRRSGPDPPRVRFSRVGEIPLPGPLPGDSPRLLEDGRIEIRTAGGSIRVLPIDGAAPQFEAAPPIPPLAPAVGDLRWIESPDGRWRFRTRPSGRVEAERLRRGRWHPAWRLAVAGGTPSAPLVRRRRVLFSALDNLLYCVRRDNGHRVWVSDIGERASRSPVDWSATVAADRAETVDVVVVTPDSGSAVLALDPYDGSRAAAYEPESSGSWLVGRPVVTPSGLLVVARQGYAPEDAGLLLLELEAVERRGDEAPPDAL